MRKVASALFEALRYGCVDRGEVGYRVEVHVASDAGIVADLDPAGLVARAVVEDIELGAGVLVAAVVKTSAPTVAAVTHPSIDRL